MEIATRWSANSEIHPDVIIKYPGILRNNVRGDMGSIFNRFRCDKKVIFTLANSLARIGLYIRSFSISWVAHILHAYEQTTEPDVIATTAYALARIAAAENNIIDAQYYGMRSL